MKKAVIGLTQCGKEMPVVQNAGGPPSPALGATITGQQHRRSVKQVSFSFEPRDYIRFMPYDATDQFKGRRHICPICGKQVWSCWGNADKHWQGHR